MAPSRLEQVMITTHVAAGNGNESQAGFFQKHLTGPLIIQQE